MGSPSRLDYGIYALLSIVWGSTWLAIKVGLEGAPPLLAASLRFFLAAAILLPLTVLIRAPWPRGRVEWSVVAFVGVVLFVFDYALIYWAQSVGLDSALAAILFATMPFQTALMAHALVPKERLTGIKILGISMGFAGVFLIFGGGVTGAASVGLLAMLAVVLSAACASAASVAVKRWGPNANPYSWNAVAMAIGAVGLLILSLGAGEPLIAPGWPQGVLSILYLAVFGTVVAFVGYVRLLRTFPVTTMSLIAFITPVVAVFLGLVVAGESLAPLVGIGAGITLAGVFVSTWRRRVPLRGTAESAPVPADTGKP
ncbi:MAG: EamA family transporter [Thermoplasmata archaeon]